MANNNINAYCSICGKGYKMCNSCVEQKSIKPWRTVTDTIEHYKIYLAIHGYTVSKDKESAKKELEQCNLSELESFNSEIKSVIKEIMAEPRKNFVSKKEKNTLESKVNETKGIKTKENEIIE